MSQLEHRIFEALKKDKTMLIFIEMVKIWLIPQIIVSKHIESKLVLFIYFLMCAREFPIFSNGNSRNALVQKERKFLSLVYIRLKKEVIDAITINMIFKVFPVLSWLLIIFLLIQVKDSNQSVIKSRRNFSRWKCGRNANLGKQ